jgi:disulfide bond formation protein DsbB
VTHAVIVALAVLAIAGQVITAGIILVAGLAAAGVRRPFETLRRSLWGYELWAAFVVAAIATGGSLFLSDIAGFVPCELCWYQRICMYPLSIITLAAAIRNDHRIAGYLLPFPVIGAAVSTYHLLVENGVVGQSTVCRLSAPGGCATKWIEEFGYVTIPTLAITAFGLLAALLVLAVSGRADAHDLTTDPSEEAKGR